VPALTPLAAAVAAALDQLRAGHHLGIHCAVGRGRTGLFAACLARSALGLSGQEQIVRGWNG